jgi:hypothetical protein
MQGRRSWVLQGLAAACCAALVACASEDGAAGRWRTAREPLPAGAAGYFEDYGLRCEARSEQGHVRLTIYNDSAQDVAIFRWNTVWDRYGDALQLRRADTGEEIPYRGPILNRVQPAPASAHLAVPAGGRLDGDYDVGKWYGLNGGGPVEASLRRDTMTVTIGENQYVLAHECGFGMLELEAPDLASVQQALSPHEDCASWQKENIRNAINGAMQLSYAALVDRAYNPFARARWFGDQAPWPSGFYERILDNPDDVIRCGGDPCNEYDVPSIETESWLLGDRVYLCNRLWDYPYLSGTERSHVEALIHELAHLYDVPIGKIVNWKNPGCNQPTYPDDECVGYPNALGLASRCAECAQRNATSYPGFAYEAFIRPALLATIQ